MQTMVLQSQYEIPTEPGKHTPGWVVPVPAVPEIYSMDADRADRMFRTLAHVSRPEFIRWSDILLYLLLSIMTAGYLCNMVSYLRIFSRYKIRMRKASFCVVLVSFVALMLLSLSMVLGARAWKGSPGVEVIQSGKVGIYDTKVVKAESAKDLIEWFNTHSFRFDASDEQAIQSDDRSAVSSNLLAPLILHLPTANPVYPTALTATGGHPTEVLIYLATDGLRKATSSLLPEFSGFVPLPIADMLLESGIPPDSEPIQLLGRENLCLHIFKETLAPEQMKTDIGFVPDLDGGFRWKVLFQW